MVYDYKQYNKYALIFRSSKINLVSTENSVTQKIKIVLILIPLKGFLTKILGYMYVHSLKTTKSVKFLPPPPSGLRLKF